MRRPSVVEAISGAVVVLLVVAAFAPSLLAPGNPLAIDPLASFQPPSWAHPLGTDESGRDLYTRIVHGAAPSLLIGVLATVLGVGLGVVLGVAGGLGPRWLDVTSTRLVEVLFAFPGLLLALLFIAIAGPGPVTSTIAVGLATAPGYARLVRSQALSVRRSGYVEAAVVLAAAGGAGSAATSSPTSAPRCLFWQPWALASPSSGRRRSATSALVSPHPRQNGGRCSILDAPTLPRSGG